MGKAADTAGVGDLARGTGAIETDFFSQVLAAGEKPHLKLMQAGWGQDKVEIIITVKAGLKFFNTIGIKSSDADLDMMPQSWSLYISETDEKEFVQIYEHHNMNFQQQW